MQYQKVVMNRVILIVVVVLVSSLNGMSQIYGEKPYDQDSISMHFDLGPVTVMPRTFRSKADLRKYLNLAKKVKKVYPIAKTASLMVQYYEASFQKIENEKDRKKYVKEIEKKLIAEYTPEMKSMTTSEGRILIKLIDRETSHTSYQLIKELRGGLQAFFWQGVARIFGHNLKDNYDPEEEDKMIEMIIFYLDMGIL